MDGFASVLDVLYAGLILSLCCHMLSVTKGYIVSILLMAAFIKSMQYVQHYIM